MGLGKLRPIAEENVERVRAQFMEKYATEEPSEFYEQDIEAIRNHDWYIKRFFIAAYKNEAEAVDRLLEAMKWRKANAIRDVPDNYFPSEFYESGGVFQYENDLNGLPTLWIRVFTIPNIPEFQKTFEKLFRHMLFKVDELAYGNGYCVILDFTATSASSFRYLHFNLLRNFTTTIVNYFPVGPDYAIVYGLPRILKTGWNIVRYLIPEKRRNLIRFVYGEEIFEQIDRASVPRYLRGTCSRSYKTAPARCPQGKDFVLNELKLSEEDYKRMNTQFEIIRKKK